MKTSHSLRGQAVILEPVTNDDNLIQPLIDSVTPLILRQHSAGQTGPMLLVQDALGNTISSIDAAGAFPTGSLAAAVILAPAASTRNVVQPTGDFKALVLKGFAGQTQNPFEIQDSTGAVLANFNASGRVTATMANFRGDIGGDDQGTPTAFSLRPVTVTPGSNADVTLSAAQLSSVIIALATGSWLSAHNIIVPNTSGATYHVSNATGFTATVKTASGTGVAIPTGFAAFVRSNGTDVKQMTPFQDPSSGAIAPTALKIGADPGGFYNWVVAGDDSKSGVLFQANSTATPGTADVITEWRNHSGQQLVQVQDSGGFTNTVQINTKDVNDTALSINCLTGQVASIFNIFTTGVGRTFDVGPGTIGFYGASPVTKRTGASAAGIAAIIDANAKAAVGALQTALANLGLITSPA